MMRMKKREAVSVERARQIGRVVAQVGFNKAAPIFDYASGDSLRTTVKRSEMFLDVVNEERRAVGKMPITAQERIDYSKRSTPDDDAIVTFGPIDWDGFNAALADLRAIRASHV